MFVTVAFVSPYLQGTFSCHDRIISGVNIYEKSLNLNNINYV